MEFQEFEVRTVSLKDGSSNLVEASAGTGKTYSIAILVLRLLVEKKMPIQEILMVTFTTAAVAELQERIRKFIREAHRYCLGEEIGDQLIKSIVDQADREEVIQLLNSALINLDEISVFTIHSFCQQTLNEFAFETGQLFSAELISDDTEIIEKEIQDFWRKHITTIREDFLVVLSDSGLSHDNIAKHLKNHLSGKKFFFYDEESEYVFDEKKQQEFIEKINERSENVESVKSLIFEEIQNQKEQFLIELDAQQYARKYFLPLIDSSEDLINKVREILNKNRKDGKSKYVQNFPKLINWVDEIDQSLTDFSDSILESLNYLYSFAIQEISNGIRRFKTNHNLMTFDDLISNLNRALNDRENSKLEQLLQTKYKAVFIDEFQDTDRQQYGIFKKAFQGNSILFYIGDPKQSIYAWRKADIATYFEARNDVENVFTMNMNFRSTEGMVNALNQFFQPEEGFDVFAYGEQENRIEYHNVESKGKSTRLYFGNSEAVPMTITTKPNKGDIIHDTALGILDLLNNSDYQFIDNESGEKRKVKTSDIGVLVRAKKDGDAIKKELAKYGIPAVSVTESKILKSPEAQDLCYILQAIDKNTASNVNRALFTVFINSNKEKIQKLDGEKVIEKFKTFKELWQTQGVYAMMMNFISEFQIKENALAGKLKDSERNITNLYHLLELLYKTENRQKMNPTELIDWLKINMSLDSNAEDEWIQRIESDEESVKIATIHSSKGLEYNIVFAPFLDLTIRNNGNSVVSFRDDGGHYKSAPLDQLPVEKQRMCDVESLQENRRLIYVALTRSVYKCFVFTSTWSGFNDSALKPFVKNREYNELISEWDAESIDSKQKYVPSQNLEQIIIRPDHFYLGHKSWQRMSYSGLAAKKDWIPKDQFLESDNDYDRFVFSRLGKGARTGTLLHGIFEKIDFSQSDEQWNNTLKRELEGYKSENASDYNEFSQMLIRLLNQVLNADLPAAGSSFKLSEVRRSDCLHELEFDFPVFEFMPKELNQILPDNRITVSDRYQSQIEGLMTGFVDLFFEHSGKYYVLDWKSNYLGPNVEDYLAENLDKVMTENNYHLQYLIYSLAIKKYLKSRLGGDFDFDRDFGGVFYLFLRGMREGTSNGVFYKKVSSEELTRLEELISVGV
ncbi:MAG: exodeoxyribonuclease V subunit beta [Weeksellaceae bacterium]